MECKYAQGNAKGLSATRINRYIMECKSSFPLAFTRPSAELIDTLWNVNRELEQILGKWKPELIDTLWNVNYRGINLQAIHGRELIDTLWNVNSAVALTFSPDSGINRYIMECKCKFVEYSTFCDCELIDTLWNVNQRYLPFYFLRP